jgi:hypothetical protein
MPVDLMSGLAACLQVGKVVDVLEDLKASAEFVINDDGEQVTS